MAEELFTRPKQGFASRGDVRKKDHVPVNMKDLRGAPLHLGIEEANSWADGYNAALRDLGLLE